MKTGTQKAIIFLRVPINSHLHVYREPYDILKVKDASHKFVYLITEYIMFITLQVNNSNLKKINKNVISGEDQTTNIIYIHRLHILLTGHGVFKVHNTKVTMFQNLIL